MINRLPLAYRIAGPDGVTTQDHPSSGKRNAAARALTNAGRCIGAYPIASLATAFVAGLALGSWVKAK